MFFTIATPLSAVISNLGFCYIKASSVKHSVILTRASILWIFIDIKFSNCCSKSLQCRFSLLFSVERKNNIKGVEVMYAIGVEQDRFCLTRRDGK